MHGDVHYFPLLKGFVRDPSQNLEKKKTKTTFFTNLTQRTFQPCLSYIFSF